MQDTRDADGLPSKSTEIIHHTFEAASTLNIELLTASPMTRAAADQTHPANLRCAQSQIDVAFTSLVVKSFHLSG